MAGSSRARGESRVCVIPWPTPRGAGPSSLGLQGTSPVADVWGSRCRSSAMPGGQRGSLGAKSPSLYTDGAPAEGGQDSGTHHPPAHTTSRKCTHPHSLLAACPSKLPRMVLALPVSASWLYRAPSLSRSGQHVNDDPGSVSHDPAAQTRKHTGSLVDTALTQADGALLQALGQASPCPPEDTQTSAHQSRVWAKGGGILGRRISREGGGWGHSAAAGPFLRPRKHTGVAH